MEVENIKGLDIFSILPWLKEIDKKLIYIPALHSQRADSQSPAKQKEIIDLFNVLFEILEEFTILLAITNKFFFEKIQEEKELIFEKEKYFLKYKRNQAQRRYYLMQLEEQIIKKQKMLLDRLKKSTTRLVDREEKKIFLLQDKSIQYRYKFEKILNNNFLKILKKLKITEISSLDFKILYQNCYANQIIKFLHGETPSVSFEEVPGELLKKLSERGIVVTEQLKHAISFAHQLVQKNKKVIKNFEETVLQLQRLSADPSLVNYQNDILNYIELNKNSNSLDSFLKRIRPLVNSQSERELSPLLSPEEKNSTALLRSGLWAKSENVSQSLPSVLAELKESVEDKLTTREEDEVVSSSVSPEKKYHL